MGMQLLVLNLTEIPASPACGPSDAAEHRDQGEEHRDGDEEHDGSREGFVVRAKGRNPHETDEHDCHECRHGEGDSSLLRERDKGLLFDLELRFANREQDIIDRGYEAVQTPRSRTDQASTTMLDECRTRAEA